MKQDKFYLRIIALLSVVVPVVVAVLMFVPDPFRFSTYDFKFLSHLNGVLNTSTALCLLLGLYFIKVKKSEKLHRLSMFVAFTLSALFLISYVIYHSQVDHTIYGGEGLVKKIYLFILLTHIILSVTVIPLVLTSIYFAITKRIETHKRIVKYTFPIWFYVATSGVVVYLMIKPYY